MSIFLNDKESYFANYFLFKGSNDPLLLFIGCSVQRNCREPFPKKTLQLCYCPYFPLSFADHELFCIADLLKMFNCFGQGFKNHPGSRRSIGLYFSN